MLDLTILCRVVDNFGDIGVVYRLARAITELSQHKTPGAPYTHAERSDILAERSDTSTQNPSTNSSASATRSDTPASSHTDALATKIRIVVDSLESFSLLNKKIDPKKDFQTLDTWEIYRWDAHDQNLYAFQKNPPQVIIECFQCGRPDWLEKLLFETGVKQIVDIIMLDYLTAEDYAETFHKLKSLTRTSRVQKVNFMMGFTQKTGGLILDRPFMQALQNRKGGESLPLAPDAAVSHRSTASSYATPSAGGSAPRNAPRFYTVFFSYPTDCTPIIHAFERFNQKIGGTFTVKLAKGAGLSSFKDAYTEYKNTKKNTFTVMELPFLSQTDWDRLLVQTPVLFIRGEDSLSRACLSGNPFVWHAYPQTEEYHLVKVNALLCRLKPFFVQEDFKIIEKCWILYNRRGSEPLELENAVYDFLNCLERLKNGFADFSNSLLQNGNLAKHIVDFALERQTAFLQGKFV